MTEPKLTRKARKMQRMIDKAAKESAKELADRYYTLCRLVAHLAKHKNGISLGDLHKIALSEGIPEDQVRSLLKNLSDAGQLYCPQPGYYRLTD